MLRQLPRSMMSSWKARHLKTVQGGLCPICQQPIDLSIPKEGVIDHDHDTGEIRGVLHRSCNAAEGKVANAAGRWGAKSMEYSKLIPWLENMLKYLKQPGTGYMYYQHKTADDKREERNKRAREARAAAKAKVALRSRRGN